MRKSLSELSAESYAVSSGEVWVRREKEKEVMMHAKEGADGGKIGVFVPSIL